MSVLPAVAVPVIVGGAEFTGGAGVGAGVDTKAVCDEVALAEPAAFVAVTLTRRVRPTSAATSLYVEALAPAMSTQLDPEEEQRRHRYAYVTVVGLDQVPGLAVSVWSRSGGPEMVGGDVLTGLRAAAPASGAAARSPTMTKAVMETTAAVMR